MNLNDMIAKYNKAIESDKVMEAQYQMLETQMSKMLTELGMTYEEVLEKEKALKKSVNESLPKIQAYIEAVEEKKQLAEEQFV
jgi:predicted lipase